MCKAITNQAKHSRFKQAYSKKLPKMQQAFETLSHCSRPQRVSSHEPLKYSGAHRMRPVPTAFNPTQ
eukprot:6079229-Amphidinium_carterae.2